MQTRGDLIGQLAGLRRRRGLTQQRLGALSGVAQQQISLIERGHVEPRIDTLLALAATLGARLVLLPVEAADPPGSTFAGTPEERPERTGVAHLVVPDEEGSEA